MLVFVIEIEIMLELNADERHACGPQNDADDFEEREETKPPLTTNLKALVHAR